jgi:hypothetical protein
VPEETGHANFPCMRFPNVKLCATCCALFGKMFTGTSKIVAPWSNRG